MTQAPDVLPPRQAYGMWAATYDEENAVSSLDDEAVTMLTPALGGAALLDAGCGTARRLVFEGGGRPRIAAGIDLTFDMLLRSRHDPRRSPAIAAADVCSIPFADGIFDVVWCRLAAGHIPDIRSVYRELARVLRPGGVVIITDFHPEAARQGHVRSFRDAAGARHIVEHFIHDVSDHDAAAAGAHLHFDAQLDLGIGRSLRHFYEAANALARYERDRGLPLLFARRYRR